jgi:hypothetical protein
MKRGWQCFAYQIAVYATLILAALVLTPSAEVIIPSQPGNLVVVNVAAQVAFDAASGLYTYTYRVTSSATSAQEVWLFEVEVRGPVVNLTSPRGWSALVAPSGRLVSWGATEIGPLPPNFVDDGNVRPSPFQIKPDQTLGGFSFQSPEPPGASAFFAQGFTKLPAVTEDAGELSQEEFAVLDLKFKGVTVAPAPR